MTVNLEHRRSWRHTADPNLWLEMLNSSNHVIEVFVGHILIKLFVDPNAVLAVVQSLFSWRHHWSLESLGVAYGIIAEVMDSHSTIATVPNIFSK